MCAIKLNRIENANDMQGGFYTLSLGKKCTSETWRKNRTHLSFDRRFLPGSVLGFLWAFSFAPSQLFLSAVQLLSPRILLSGEGFNCARGSGAPLLLAMPGEQSKGNNSHVFARLRARSMKPFPDAPLPCFTGLLFNLYV